MKRASACFLLLVLGCDRCAEEPPSASDAGPPPVREIVDKELGFRIPLAPGWDVVSPGEMQDVRTIGRAIRAPGARPFLVAPRLVVTEKKIDERDPQLAFRITQADLKAVTKRPGVELLSSSMGLKTVDGHPAADLEIMYKAKLKGGPREISQRSLVIYKKGHPSAGNRLIEISASYMARDTGLVGGEIQQMFVNAGLK